MAEPVGTAEERWSARADAEAASARVMEELAAELEARLGATELALRLRGAAEDERRHAALCAPFASPSQETRRLAPPTSRGAGPVERLLEGVIFLLAAGEPFAIAQLQATIAAGPAPEVRAVLESILADELRHAALGWELVDALLADPSVDRAVIAPLALRVATHAMLAAARSAPVVGDHDRGVLSRAEVDVVVRAAMERWVGPSLLRRGLWPAGAGAAER